MEEERGGHWRIRRSGRRKGGGFLCTRSPLLLFLPRLQWRRRHQQRRRRGQWHCCEWLPRRPRRPRNPDPILYRSEESIPDPVPRLQDPKLSSLLVTMEQIVLRSRTVQDIRPVQIASEIVAGGFSRERRGLRRLSRVRGKTSEFVDGTGRMCGVVSTTLLDRILTSYYSPIWKLCSPRTEAHLTNTTPCSFAQTIKAQTSLNHIRDHGLAHILSHPFPRSGSSQIPPDYLRHTGQLPPSDGSAGVDWRSGGICGVQNAV